MKLLKIIKGMSGRTKSNDLIINIKWIKKSRDTIPLSDVPYYSTYIVPNIIGFVYLYICIIKDETSGLGWKFR
jgi:hypothetical protein